MRWMIAGGATIVAFVCYMMVWTLVDELRWGRPEMIVYPMLIVVLVAERVRWLLR